MSETRLFGMRIIENRGMPFHVSNFQLDPKLPLTDEARKRHQAWLDDFFGVHEVAVFFDADKLGIPGGFGIPGGPTVVLGTAAYRALIDELPPRYREPKP